MKGFFLTFYCLFFCCSIIHAQQEDIKLLRAVYAGNRSMDAMHALSQSTYPISILCPVAVYAFSSKQDSNALLHTKQVLYSMATAAIFTYGTKWLINRARPYETYADIIPYNKEIDPSFPSGHTSMAFNTAMNISMLSHQPWVKITAFTWASAIAYSRLYLGEHYPSDIIAGALIGAGSAYLSSKAQAWLLYQNRKKKRSHDF
ncbi:MAG: phosphatase PAP2 family protein [Chitinophagia bacterium]|nr:phosphatase PAP2 family protein [Chitinophagia bacterium]